MPYRKTDEERAILWEFGFYLSELLQRKGWTNLDELSVAMAREGHPVRPDTLRSWLVGKHRPRRPGAKVLARVLRLSEPEKSEMAMHYVGYVYSRSA